MVSDSDKETSLMAKSPKGCRFALKLLEEQNMMSSPVLVPQITN